MRIQYGFALKHVSWGTIIRNYWTRDPPPAEEFYYDKEIDVKVKEIKVRTIEITIENVNMSEMGVTIVTRTPT